jgi:hypothetical protein
MHYDTLHRSLQLEALIMLGCMNELVQIYIIPNDTRAKLKVKS